jgi:hypothetical protein
VVMLLLELKRRFAGWRARYSKVRKLYQTHRRENGIRAERLLRSGFRRHSASSSRLNAISTSSVATVGSATAYISLG